MTTNCSQLKMIDPDGKIRLRDAMNTSALISGSSVGFSQKQEVHNTFPCVNIVG